MSSLERPDDFNQRRKHLHHLSDQELQERFWHLVNKIVDPLITEAKCHTSPAIERSVLLRMGFSSVESSQLVEQMLQRKLLGYGAGHLILQLAKRKSLSVRDIGEALLQGQYWQELKP